jgi:5-methylcytosine-specific restriction enzyme subunit McrC
MEIPIQNIYYLLCYAWDKLEEKELVDVDPSGMTTLVDLFSRVLVNGTRHLLKRGFDRNYVAHDECTSRLRGRIEFHELATAGAATATLPCEFDELSYDVFHNQILKATMRRLTRADCISHENADALVGLCRQLSDVRDIEITSRLFGQVQLHRNNKFYDFLLKVCELVHHNLLVSEVPGRSRFSDFVRDRQQMAILYESFVRNFYRINSRFQVRREDIRWRTWTPEDEVSAGLLPKMQTDISLMAPDRKIIIDCKYTPEATQHHFSAETLRSAHLYQLNAYLSNLPQEQATCEGMLLYPTVDEAVSATFTNDKHRIRIRTINLNQPWQGIHEHLLALVNDRQ